VEVVVTQTLVLSLPYLEDTVTALFQEIKPPLVVVFVTVHVALKPQQQEVIEAVLVDGE